MSDILSRRRFLSLWWKLLLPVLLLMIGLTLLLGALAYRELWRQQEHLLAVQRYGLQQQLRQLLHQSLESTSSSVYRLMLSADMPLFASQPNASALNSQWHQLNSREPLQAFGRIASGGQQAFYLGLPPDEDDFEWFARRGDVVEADWRVRCAERCLLQSLLPLQHQGGEFLFYLAQDLTPLLEGFRPPKEFELALLGASDAAVGPFWGRQLYRPSSHQSSLRRLEQDFERWHWQAIISGQQLYDAAGQAYTPWFYPLGDSETAPGILVLWSMSEWQTLLKAFLQNLLGILLLALLLSWMLLALLLWPPIRRLAQYSRLLPRMTDTRRVDWEGLQLPKGSLLWDEVDLMRNALMDLFGRQRQQTMALDAHTMELERLAMQDMLTGLPNAALLRQELDTAIACVGRQQQQLALLYLNLDAFNRIYFALGHADGDELLKTTASRLKHCLRKSDTLCREHSDEFLILLRGVRDQGQVHLVIHNIFTALQQPQRLGNHQLIITACIGVAICDSTEVSGGELIAQAKLAMLSAKDAGRGNFRVFSDEMLLARDGPEALGKDIGNAMGGR